MTMIRICRKRLSAVLLAVLFAGVSCERESAEAPGRDLRRGMSLRVESEELLPQQVATRATTPKTEEEKEVRSLHLFLFDGDPRSATYGEFLVPADPDFRPYQRLDGNTVLRIPEGVFSGSKARKALVVAVANVDPDTFRVGSDGMPEEVGRYADLAAWHYEPVRRQDIRRLPDAGMPMCGMATVDLTKTSGEAVVRLTALMARVDVKLRVEAAQTSGDGRLPNLSVLQWGVKNLPKSVPLLPLPSGGVTEPVGFGDETIVTTGSEPLTSHGGELTFSFYMYENVQHPRPPYDSRPYPYPPGISGDDRQRWKPELADAERAAAFTMRGVYVNDQNIVYRADFTFYLGANHTDNFEVVRNRCYRNSITVTGITHVGNNPDHVTFDARVDVSTENPYFVSILRERNHDAHFNVTPMDIYLFRGDAGLSPTMEVRILPDSRGGVPSWIRLERIPAATMQAGRVVGGVRKPWAAGTGKRPYFTTTLLDELSRGDGGGLSARLAHRDRVYFYIDENLGDDVRSAFVRLDYREGGTTVRVDTLELAQAPLIAVDVACNGVRKRIYIETYEEYLEYYDPLDEHLNGNLYDGLEWGLHGRYMHGGNDWNPNIYWSEVYLNGLEATERIVTLAGQRVMDLNTPPASAAQYCNNKNKRNPTTHEVDNPKWYLPGLVELEAILASGYNRFPEFQRRFYWSASAAKRRSRFFGWAESNEYARATKVVGSGQYAESGGDAECNYTGEYGTGGRTPRRGAYLRIRAARVDKCPQ